MRKRSHRGAADHSTRPGCLRKGDTVWVWSVLDDSYVLVQSTGPTDMSANEGRLPEGQEGGKPDVETKLATRHLPKQLADDLYNDPDEDGDEAWVY